MITEDRLKRDLLAKNLSGKTLREIAKEYGDGITHADIQRGIKGDFPKSEHKRFILGLPALIPTPACNKCGEVHVRRRCPNTSQAKTTPRRVAIRTDDMRSAAATILRNIEPEKIKELMGILSNGRRGI
jgi:hypothetical protein